MRVCIALTPSIGSIGKKGIAGTERMFFKDIELLSQSYSISAFARFSFSSPKIAALRFPLFAYQFSLPFFRRFSFESKKFLELIANVMYLLDLWRKDPSADAYIGYSFPLIALLRKPKTIIYLHSYEEFFYPNLFSNFYRRTHFIFVSEYLKDYYFRKYTFLRKENSDVLHNSINTSVFRPLNKSNLKNKKIAFLFSGAWEEVKGLHLLLTANSRLTLDEQKRISITIASKSSLWFHEQFESNQKYVSLIRQLAKKMPNVKMLGGVEHRDMPKIYNAHDFLVFPSTWGEPCSVTLIEAIACGVPVIAFPVGGNMEILTESKNIILKETSTEALRRALEKILKKYHRPMKRKSLFTQKNMAMTDKIRQKKLTQIVANL